MKNPVKNLIKSPDQLAPAAQELAWKEAEARGLPITRICVIATPFGSLRAVVLDD